MTRSVVFYIVSVSISATAVAGSNNPADEKAGMAAEYSDKLESYREPYSEFRIKKNKHFESQLGTNDLHW